MPDKICPAPRPYITIGDQRLRSGKLRLQTNNIAHGHRTKTRHQSAPVQLQNLVTFGHRPLEISSDEHLRMTHVARRARTRCA